MVATNMINNLLEKTHARYGGGLALACVIILSLLIISVNPFKQVLAPMDLLHSAQGWGSGAARVVNPERSDVLDFYLPRWRYFRQQIREEHKIPIWNSVAEDGSYGIQEPSQFGLSLPFFIYVLWPDEPSGYTIAIITNFLFAALGTYLLLMFMFEDRYAAIFGAITFAFCGFNIAWAYWPHAATNACIPWVLASMLRFWQKGKLRWPFVFMVSVFLLGVSGFPFVALLGGMSAISFMLLLMISATRDGTMYVYRWRRFACLVIAGIAAVAMAAPGLDLLLSTLKHTDLTYRIGGTLLNKKDLFNLLGVNLGTRLSVEETFFCGTLAAVFSIFSFLLGCWKPNKSVVLGVLMFVFVLATAYGMAPDYIIMHIPFFSMNAWNRVGALIGLAFAILSAHFLSSVLALFRGGRWYKISLLAYSLVLIFQAVQLALQFNAYNSKPPRNEYFPPSSAISYLTGNLQPLQSAVADDGFLVSGTLGNYHIPELLGHGFRTKAQQDIIQKVAPFSKASPTASIVDCTHFNLDAPDVTYAAIRFAIFKSPCMSPVFQVVGSENVPSPDLNYRPLQGWVEIKQNTHMDLIQILFATYRKRYSGDDVKFELYRGADLVASSTLAASKIFDNEYGEFKFPARVELAPGRYDYKISVMRVKNNSPLSVWMSSSLSDGAYLIDGKGHPGAPNMTFYRNRYFKGYPKIVFHEGIQVITNPRVEGGGYFVSSLAGLPEADYSDVNLSLYAPASFDLLYYGDREGWVVAPMRYLDGWRAEINGHPVGMALFRGLFPAVHVSGPVKIRFFYDPIRFYWIVAVCVFILMFCIVLLYLLREKDNSRS